MSFSTVVLCSILKQLLRDRSFLFWAGLSGFLVAISVFLASTLLAEQREAAFAYARFVLHMSLIVGIIAWGTTYLTRLRQSGEILFWLTMPLSRFQILFLFITAFNTIVLLMVVLSSFYLSLFITDALSDIGAFALKAMFEGMFCATLTVLFGLSLNGSLKTPLAVLFIDISGHLVPTLERSLQALGPLPLTSVYGWVLSFLKGIFFILPRLGTDLMWQDLLQNIGFIGIIGFLCHNELLHKNF
jgi:hypothetical protein